MYIIVDYHVLKQEEREREREYTSNVFKFLALVIDIPHGRAKSQAELVSKFEGMLNRLDTCPLSCKQRRLISKLGVCHHLSWHLSVEELPISWVKKALDSLFIRFLKK